MQPYFLPYIGYFQLINAVDAFVVYDNIKYTKKGWINRNRFLRNGEAVSFAVPLKKDSDFLDVRDRVIAPDYQPKKLANQFAEAYRKAPFFQETFSLLEEVLNEPNANLFGYIFNSLRRLCAYLNIQTELRISSGLPLDHSLMGEARVIDICRHLRAETYINAIGGVELYQASNFSAQGIQLRFHQSTAQNYPQFDATFVPWLSIVDVLMFNGKDRTSDIIQNQFTLKSQ